MCVNAGFREAPLSGVHRYNKLFLCLAVILLLLGQTAGPGFSQAPSRIPGGLKPRAFPKYLEVDRGKAAVSDSNPVLCLEFV